MTLGENIVRLRRERGLSQEDLANALAVSRQSVSKWETDASVPELDKLLKLSELFEITLDELVRGEQTAAKPADLPEPLPSRSVSEPAFPPRKVAGTILLCMAFVVLLLCTVMGGLLEGLIFCLPFLTCGIICFVVPKRPGLWCAWAIWFMADLFMRFATSVHWSLIRMTLSYDPSWNYTRLVMAWVQFGCMIALVLVTLWCLGREPLEISRKSIAQVGLIWGVWLGLKVVVRLLVVLMHQTGNGELLSPYHSLYYTFIAVLEPVRLALFTAGLTLIMRMLRHKKATQE